VLHRLLRLHLLHRLLRLLWLLQLPRLHWLRSLRLRRLRLRRLRLLPRLLRRAGSARTLPRTGKDRLPWLWRETRPARRTPWWLCKCPC
jgi:hypothetical protein